MKRKLFLALCALLTLAVALQGCASRSVLVSLPDGIDEKAMKAGKEVVTMLCAGDYDGVADMVREDLRDELSADVIHDAVDDLLADSGAFDAYQSINVVGMTQDSETFACVVLTCSFAEAERTFTLSFDFDMKMIGLYMK